MRQTVRMDFKSDQYYIGQVINGNVNSYSHLVDRYKDHAFSLALKICGNSEEAEEIAQDAFLKAFRGLAGFRQKSSFSTWLYRIVYNTSVSLVRARKEKVLSLESFPADASDFLSSSDSEEKAEEEYRSALLNFAMKKITAEERALVTLYYLEEMNAEEISAVTGMKKSNIKVMLFRARKKMHEVLEKAEQRNVIYNE